MRHYTISDQLYRSDVKSYLVEADETPQSLQLAPASKTLFLRNEGLNDVHIAFDSEHVSTSDFKLSPTDGLVKIKVQCKVLSFICAAGESASVRVSSNF